MTVLERDYSEKRDFIRMAIDASAMMKLPDENTERKCLCRDLSAVGMLLEVNREIKPGTLFDITLPTQTKGFESLTARAEVTRCVAYQGNRFLIGARIEQIG